MLMRKIFISSIIIIAISLTFSVAYATHILGLPHQISLGNINITYYSNLIKSIISNHTKIGNITTVIVTNATLRDTSGQPHLFNYAYLKNLTLPLKIKKGIYIE